MLAPKTYPVIDSSITHNAFDTVPSDLSTKPKSITDSYFNETDTFYGIKNETSIPIRSIKNYQAKTPTIKKVFAPEPKVINVFNWQIVILVICLLLLGFAKAFTNKRFKQAIKGLYNYGVAVEVTREEKVFFHQSNLVLSLIHLLTSALFIFKLNELFRISGLGSSNFLAFSIILGFIALTYFAKYIFAKILFHVLNDKNIVSEYVYNISIYNNLLGVVLIPILLLSYFSAISFPIVLFYMALPLMALIFLFRLIRLFFIGATQGISYFYIFVYICTLEILPLVVLFRIFIIK